ncbi:hypothetical protein CXG81DRAFT_15942 [Caulochytrium protostelioides]|uniref:LIM zinc-binding domain-containing protein n=1 Tax=Caulochytrium protostelioides TaxID=1555241 RepID=A0A4P9WZS5_9FUNG|nr:hypothetical protein CAUPRSCDRAFT_5762 [Caulochytrium protostelioides]RKO98416.1 hypothetical protein CXG81DRAFT_15942 [Caulochytrium protostelioides]|eukprot:RKO98416.1 hypothetical protein CXG81DRAFT_15942 [Caulochytrium protostelioides]
MASEPCNACTKKVYHAEKIEAADAWYHKGCFKCSDTACGIQLTLKSFKVAESQVWCEKHLPKPKATAVADTLATVHALRAPKKTAEGLHKTHVGIGEAVSLGVDSVLVQHATHAPPKPVENTGHIQKGSIAHVAVATAATPLPAFVCLL